MTDLFQPKRIGSKRLTLRQQLIRGGIGSLAIKFIHTGSLFLLTVFLARTLGAEGYGVYTFALSLIMLLAIPAQVGLPQLVVRETAKAQTIGAWGLIRGLWHWSNSFVVAFSLAMVITGIGLLWLGAEWLEGARSQTLAVGLALIPLIALTNVRGAAIRGLRHVILGQLSEFVVRSSLLLIMVVTIIFWCGGILTPASVMGLHGASALVAFILSIVLLHVLSPAEIQAGPRPEYERSNWYRAIMPLALIAGLQIINAHIDIIMLGVIQDDDEEVGIYRVVVQIAMLVLFGLTAINQILQPHFARLHTQKDYARLQRLVCISARITFLFAAVPVIVMIMYGSSLLEFLFGPEYRVGSLALAILALAQLFNAGMGPVTVLLNMTGYERDCARGMMIAALMNVGLNIILIPPFGMEGAAGATAMTIIIWNLILRYYVRKRLGIETAALMMSWWKLKK